jgi:hypothetical protein
MTEDSARCANCGTTINIGDEVGAVGPKGKPEDMHMICMPCYEAEDYSNIPGMGPARLPYETAAPLSGAFKPCKDPREILELRQKSYFAPFWIGLEDDMFQMLHEWGEKLLRFSLSSRTYKGYKIVFNWQNGVITGLTFPGSSSATKPPMSVYQVHRLRGMGLQGQGYNPKEWSIDLPGTEASFENVMRVISHVLEFGYMIDVSRVDAITPILDV